MSNDPMTNWELDIGISLEIKSIRSIRNYLKMQILKSKSLNYEQIVACLKSDGIIIYPTDTAYALGCSAIKELALEKIFRIKSRDESKTLPLIVSSLEAARKWAFFSNQEEELAQRYWPGPLAMLLEAKESDLAKTVIKNGRVGLRVPDNEIARGISLHLDAPITSTSANLSGDGIFYNVKDAIKSLEAHLNLIDYIIDVGELPERSVSTIIKVCDNKIEVIREGAITF